MGSLVADERPEERNEDGKCEGQGDDGYNASTVVESPATQVSTVAETAPVGTAVDQGKGNGDDGKCEGQGDDGYNASTVVEPPGTQGSTVIN